MYIYDTETQSTIESVKDNAFVITSYSEFEQNFSSLTALTAELNQQPYFISDLGLLLKLQYYYFDKEILDTLQFDLVQTKSHIILISQNPEILISAFSSILNKANFSDLLYLFLQNLLNHNFVHLTYFESQMLELDDIITNGKFDNFKQLSHYKKDCLITTKETRILRYIESDPVLTEQSTLTKHQIQHLASLTRNIYEYATHLVEYSTHLVNTYNGIVNEKTNSTINRLTLITVFLVPFNIVSGIYGMNFYQHAWN